MLRGSTVVRPRPVRRPLARCATAAIGLLLTTASLMSGQSAQAATRPFSSTSPFNTVVSAKPKIDPKSSAMVAQATRHGQVYAGLYEFGIPIYTATAGTPRYDVSCSMNGTWGFCPLTSQKLPIPDGAVPQYGSDGAMVVIDSTNNTVAEYWRAWRSGSRWGASFGAVNSLSGSGWGGSSTGSGASRLGGVVRVSEISAGSINHALVVQSDNVCSKVYRKPAIKTDGTSTRSDCLPEGARLQLDPSINLSSVQGLTKGERAVAQALQTYGAYVIDYGGSPLSISFERASDGSWSSPGSVYKSAGFSWDFYGMPHVPWSRLRVLA